MACHFRYVRHKHNVAGWYEVQNPAGLTNCVRSQRLVISKDEKGSRDWEKAWALLGCWQGAMFCFSVWVGVMRVSL